MNTQFPRRPAPRRLGWPAGVAGNERHGMNKKDEALKLALAFIEDTAKYLPHVYDAPGLAVHTAIRKALAEQPAQQQEPAVWTATRLWNRKDTWTCPADIEKDLLDGRAMPPQPRGPREHETSEHCWCRPTLDYKDPDTGNEVWVHNEPH